MTKMCLYLALFRPPFLFGKMKKLAIHVPYSAERHNSLHCSLASSECAALQCILVQYIGCCLFCRALAVYQVQRVLTIICCCCCCCTLICFCAMNGRTPFARLCITNCAASSVYCAMCNAHLAGGDFVQCVIKEYNCFITRLRLPILSLHQHVQLQVQMFAHVQVLAQWKSSQEKSSQGRGHFPVHLFVLFGPFFFFKIDANKICF